MSERAASRFLDACGLSGPLEIEVQEDSARGVGRWSLSQPHAVVGRDPRADVVIDHDGVSKKHALIQVIAGRVFVLDLESRTGLTWDDDRARSAGWLAPGRWVRLGPVRLRVVGPVDLREPPSDPELDPFASEQVAPSAVAAQESLSEILVVFPGVERLAHVWRSGAALSLVGKAHTCAICMPDEDFSRVQAIVARTAKGVWIADVLGRVPLRVNGSRVRWARLDEGDRLDLGRYEGLVRRGGTALGSGEEGDSREPRVADRIVLPALPPETLPARLKPPPGPVAWANSEMVSNLGAEAADLRGGFEKLSESLAQPVNVRSFEAGLGPNPTTVTVESLLDPILRQVSTLQQQMFDQFHQALMMMFQMFGSLQREQMAMVRSELDRIRQLSQELQSLQLESAALRSVEKAASTAQNPPTTKPAEELGQPQGASERAAEPVVPFSLPEHPADEDRPATGADLHDLITRRIGELQAESQSRWSKLFQIVSGGSPPAS